MRAQLLAALCCLIAAASARPASPEASSCAIACPDRNFWTGYEIGQVYSYAFTQELTVSSGMNDQKLTKLRMSGKAKIEVHSTCEMQLKLEVSESKASASADNPSALESRALPEDVSASISEPLRFAFIDGEVSQLCPTSDDTRASLNIKRAVLSHLHTAIDSPEQEVTVRETDLLGDCWTKYKSLASRRIRREKDLSSCRSGFEVFPRRGQISEPSEAAPDWWSVIKGKLTCEIQLDESKDFVKSSECKETRQVMGVQGERVVAMSQLSLQSVDTLPAAAALATSDRRLDLKHQHKEPISCQSADSADDVFFIGNECQEKMKPAAGAESAHFKAAAKNAIKQLCNSTFNDTISGKSAKQYADLVKSLRGVSELKDLEEIFNWVYEGYCEYNQRLMPIVYGAISNVGTPASVKLMLNAIEEEGDITSEMSNWLTNGIAKVPQPTLEMIDAMLRFTKNSKENQGMLAGSSEPLALSALTARYCDQNPDCESEEQVGRVLEFFGENIGDKCASFEGGKSSADLSYSSFSLFAIGNIGRIKGGAQQLLDCAAKSSIPLVYRVFAVRSLRRFPSISNKERLALAKMVINNSLDAELRIAAYQIAAKQSDIMFRSSNEATSMLSKLFTDKQQNVQVQMYVYSHLKNWLKSEKQASDSGSVSDIVLKFERDILSQGRSGMGYSTQWKSKFGNEGMRAMLDVEANAIYSSKSMMPRYVNLNVTVDSPLNGEAVNIFEIGMRAEGIEDLMTSFMNYVTRGKSQKSRKRRQAGTGLNDRQSAFQQRKIIPRVDLFQRRSGMQLWHKLVDETLLNIGKVMQSQLNPASLKGLAMENTKLISSLIPGLKGADTLTESTMVIPTICGFPILLKKEIHYVSDIAIKPEFNLWKKKTYIGLSLMPTVAAYMSRTLSIDAAFERSGISTSTSVLTNTGVSLSMYAKKSRSDKDGRFLFSTSIESLKKRQNVVDFKTEAVFFGHSGQVLQKTPLISEDEAEPVSKICTSGKTFKWLGVRLCKESSYGNIRKNIWQLRQMPGEYRMYFDNNKAFRTFEVSFDNKYNKSPYQRELTITVGDKKSEKAKFQADALLKFPSSASDDAMLSLSMQNPFLPMSFTLTKNPAGTVMSNLKIGSISYILNGTMSKLGPDYRLMAQLYRGNRKEAKSLECTMGYYGMMGLLPQGRFDLTMKMSKNREVMMANYLKFDPEAASGFNWTNQLQYKSQNAVIVSYLSRLLYSKTITSGAPRMSITYDTEVKNANYDKYNVQQNFFIDSMLEGTKNKLALRSKFKYGRNFKNSLIDASATIKLNDESTADLTKMTGEGSLKFTDKTNTEKSAAIRGLTLQFGNVGSVAGFEDVSGLTLTFGADYAGSTTSVDVGFHSLPLSNWSPSRQYLSSAMKVTKPSGQQSRAQISHSAKSDNKKSVNMKQTVSFVLDDAEYFSLNHGFGPDASIDGQFNHELTALLKGKGDLRVISNYTLTYSVMKVLSSVHISSRKILGLVQSFTYKTQENIPLKLELLHSSEVLGTKRKIQYVQTYSEGSAKNDLQIREYLQKIGKESFQFAELGRLIRKYFSELNTELEMIIEWPEWSTSIKSSLDYTQTDGVCQSLSLLNKSAGKEYKYDATLNCKTAGNSISNLLRNYTLRVRLENREYTLSAGLLFRLSQQSIESLQTLSLRSNGGDTFVLQMKTDGTYPGGSSEKKIKSALTYAENGKVQCGLVYSLATQGSKGSMVPSLNSKFEIINNLMLKQRWMLPALSSELDYTSGPPAQLRFNNTLNGIDVLSLSMVLPSKSLKSGLSGNLRFRSFISILQKLDLDYKFRQQDSLQSYIQATLKSSGIEATAVDNTTITVGKSSVKFSSNSKVTGMRELLKAFNDEYAQSSYGEISYQSDTKSVSLINTVNLTYGGSTKKLAEIEISYSKWPLAIKAVADSEIFQKFSYGLEISAGMKSSNRLEAVAMLLTPGSRNSAKYLQDFVTDASTTRLNSSVVVMVPFYTSHTFSASMNLEAKGPLEVKALINGQFSDMKFSSSLDSNSRMQVGRFELNKGGTSPLVLMNFTNTIESTDNNKIGDARIHLVAPYLSEKQLKAIYIFGEDYYVGVDLNEAKVLRALWLRPGATHWQIEGVMIRQANFGVEIKFSKYYFHILRSGSGANFTWNTITTKNGAVQFQIELIFKNSRMTDGLGKALGQMLFYNSSSPGEAEFAYKPGKRGFIIIRKKSDLVSVTFEPPDRKSCVSLERVSKYNIIGKFGSCTSPNTIQARFSGDFSKSNLQLEMKIPDDGDDFLYIRPKYRWNIGFVKPLYLSLNTSDRMLKSSMRFTYGKQQELQASYSHDFLETSKEASAKFNSPNYNFGLNFDAVARKLSIQSEPIKLSANMSSLSLKVRERFDFNANILQGQTKGGATGVDLLMMKLRLNGRKEHTLEAWRGSIAAGDRMGLMFTADSGKKFSGVVDLTDWLLNESQFKMKFKSELSSDFMEDYRNFNSMSSIDFQWRQGQNEYLRQYEMNYAETVKLNNVVWYDVKASISGRKNSLPKSFSIESVAGKVIGKYGFNFDSSRKFTSNFELTKVMNSRLDYRIMISSEDYMLPLSEFYIGYNSSVRMFVLSRELRKLSTGVEEAEFQLFFHKGRKEGFAVISSKDFAVTDVYKRELKIMFPSRTVGYQRTLRKDGDKWLYDLILFWKLPIADRSRIRVTFNYEMTGARQNWAYSQRLGIKAPFLNNEMIHLMSVVSTDDSFEYKGSAIVDTVDSANITLKYQRYWSESKQAMQREFNVSFAQKKNGIDAFFGIVANSRYLQGSRVYSNYKYLTEYFITTRIPSQRIDSFVRIRSVPNEELSFASSEGATFLWRFIDEYTSSRMSFFASSSTQKAGQLTVVSDGVDTSWRATLDTGIGYINPDADLSTPFYEPENVWIRAVAGLSKCGTKLRIGAIMGEMDVSSKYSLWSPEAIPKELDFFFAGLKLQKNNTIDFYNHWRLRPNKISPFSYMRKVLVEPWASMKEMPFSPSSINKLLRGVFDSQTSNFNIMQLLTTVVAEFSTDYDRLKAWGQSARDNKDFLSGSLAAIISDVTKSASNFVVQIVKALFSRGGDRDWLPEGLSPLAIINGGSDFLAWMLSEIPVDRIWSFTVDYIRASIRSTFEELPPTLNRITDSIDSAIAAMSGSSMRYLSSIATGTSSISFPIFPILQMRISAVSMQYAAVMETAKTIMKNLNTEFTPWGTILMEDVNKANDVVKNVRYDLRRISGMFRSTRDSSSSEQMLAALSFPAGQVAYSANIIESLSLLLQGRSGDAIRQFFRTDIFNQKAYLTCSAACMNGGSYNYLKGTIYSPIYISNFRMFEPEEQVDMLPFDTSFATVLRNISAMIQGNFKIPYQSASVNDKFIITYGGEMLEELSACKYLLAHDFRNKDFSLYQTYEMMQAGTRRANLEVNFFGTNIVISRGGEISVAGETKALPISENFGKIRIDAAGTYEKVIRLHSSLNNVLVLRCSRTQCDVEINPLYSGRVNGALGSNDGDSQNDIQSGEARFWAIGRCAA